MSITEGTQPAAVTWTGAWSTAQTTASFTPEAGALLVALVSGDGNSSATVTASVTDSLSGTWTLLKRQNAGVTGVVGGTAEVWCRDSPGTALTVSVTGSAQQQPGGQLIVRTLIGAKATAQQNGATGGATTQAAAVQVSVAAGTGNRIYGAAFNFDTSTVMTPLANTTVINAFSDATNGDTWEAFKSSADTAGTATYGYSTTHNGMIAAVEILAIPTSALAPQPVLIPPGMQSPQAFKFIPQPGPFTIPPAPAITPVPEVMPNLVIARRRAARAVVQFIQVATQNAAVVTGINGTAPDHLVVARRASARAYVRFNPVETTNLPQGSIPDHLVVARRAYARAYVRFTPVVTLNGPPYGFTEAQVRMRRPYPSRAYVRFRPVSTTNAAVVTGINGTVPDHLVIARRGAARAFWRGTAPVTSNLPQGSQPDGLVRRRSTARAVIHGVPPGFANNLPVPNIVDHLVIARRASARAYARFTPVITVNAVPGGPVNGTVPDHLVIARRPVARAYVQFIPVRTVNAVPVTPVNGTVPDHLVIGRRTAARVVWRPTLTETANLQNGNQPDGRVYRRSAARAYWRPTGTETVNRPPNVAQAGALIRRRNRARGQWLGFVAPTVNQPPPPFDKGYSVNWTVTEAASMKASVGEAASMQAAVKKSASSQSGVS